MGRKKAKVVKQEPKAKLPKMDLANTEFFECPHCKSANFQLKQQFDKAMAIQCVDCGDEWEVELAEECEECVVEYDEPKTK